VDGSSAAPPDASVPDAFGWTDRIAEPFLALLGERLTLSPRSGTPRHVMKHPSTGERTGEIAISDGRGLEAFVLSTASTPMMRMWQAVAFTPPASPLPHLSFDAKANPGGCWFSVDLVPRVACTEEPAWTRHIYEPLSELVWELQARDDLRPSQLRAAHRAHLSPWLISMRLEEESAVDAAIEAVTAVTERFCALVDEGLPPDAMPSLDGEALAARDARERAFLYSWEATANYRYLAMIGGDESVDIVQQVLRTPDA
jgi:hypothetical protein